jgi:hypothetical protein
MINLLPSFKLMEKSASYMSVDLSLSRGVRIHCRESVTARHLGEVMIGEGEG